VPSGRRGAPNDIIGRGTGEGVAQRREYETPILQWTSDIRNSRLQFALFYEAENSKDFIVIIGCPDCDLKLREN
jgi:hypothetical protein